MKKLDYKAIEEFINGCRLSAEDTFQDYIKQFNDLPDIINFLIKTGNDEYDIVGTLLPKDKYQKEILCKVLPNSIEKMKNCEILCTSQTFYEKNRLLLKFTNHINKKETSSVYYINTKTPFEISDTYFHFMGSTMSLN